MKTTDAPHPVKFMCPSCKEKCNLIQVIEAKKFSVVECIELGRHTVSSFEAGEKRDEWSYTLFEVGVGYNSEYEDEDSFVTYQCSKCQHVVARNDDALARFFGLENEESHEKCQYTMRETRYIEAKQTS